MSTFTIIHIYVYGAHYYFEFIFQDIPRLSTRASFKKF